MKKLSLMFLLLVAGLFFTACGDDSDVPANGYIETTEEGSATFILKGYEDASDGFNVFEGEGFEKSFYILEKKFTGSAWSFVRAASGPLSAMTEIPADNAWQVDMDVVEGANYWARNKGMTKYTFMRWLISRETMSLWNMPLPVPKIVIFRRMKMPISRRVTTFP